MRLQMDSRTCLNLRKNRVMLLSLFMLLAAAGFTPAAWGWGCKGHEVVALIAEAHLTAHAKTMVADILAAGPISPDLRRYCDPTGLDVFSDSSTWADDERSIRPETAGWHFLDIPRGAPKGNIAQYCPPATSCVTTAIVDQLAVLRRPDASVQARADALRFLIHFVGDLHQPLHSTTNNDRGGNCVPIAFFGNEPAKPNPATEDYRPNLHGIWDTDILEHFYSGQTVQQIADGLEIKFKTKIPALRSKRADVKEWAWESHQVAEHATYGYLPVKIAIETPTPVTACADDNHISTRMLDLHEHVDVSYGNAAVPVIQQQLTRAGIRLATLLNNLWP